MKQALAWLLPLLAAAPVLAQRADPEQLLRDFSRCDDTLFRSLAKDRAAFEQLAPLRTNGPAAAFAVENRADLDASTVRFRRPLRVAGVELIGFFDEIQRIPHGFMFSWGFLVASTVDKTTAAVRNLLWDGDRLRWNDPYHVRSEVWDHRNPGQGWQKIKTESGAPAPGTVERVLLIEPFDDEAAFIRITCSYQGTVDAEMIQASRPDLTHWLR